MNDNEDILAAEREMTEAVKQMESQINAVAMARQVVEFGTERRKAVLSRLVVPHLNDDCSAAEAEHRARADERYKTECKQIMESTANAEAVLLAYEVTKNKFEAARSILSTRRAQIGLT